MNKKERQFANIVLEHYRVYGRHELPWRNTRDPYKIVVSELMLQQTQVDRVVPKYVAFVKMFPTVKELAVAPFGDVLRLWQGLGYNRRARYLHQTAKIVDHEWGGVFPSIRNDLEALPGIGKYTAGAVMTFAYNKPVALIETNVRQVYLHHFFKNKTAVSDSSILHLVEKTIWRKCPREWYWALMDYGAYLKQQQGNRNQQSKHYVKHEKFCGSDRQIRGAIISILVKNNAVSISSNQLQTQLVKLLPQLEGVSMRVMKQLARLKNEGMIKQKRDQYFLG